jgi:hypothetical protein
MNRRQSHNPHGLDPEFEPSFFPLLVTTMILVMGVILSLLWLAGCA